MDSFISKKINSFAGRWKWLDVLAIFCAKYLPYLLLAILIIFSVLNRRYYILFYPLLSAFFAIFVVNKLIYLFYKEARPSELKETKTLISVPKNPSFPSRHAAFFFAASFSLFLYDVFLFQVFILCSCIIGVARVFTGVHWLKDILGGVITGFLSAIIVYYLFNIWKFFNLFF